MKILLTGYLFDFEKGSASTNLAVEYAKGFNSNGFETVLISHSNKKNYKYGYSIYKGIKCISFKNYLGILKNFEKYFYSIYSIFSLWKYIIKNRRSISFIFAFSTHASQLTLQIIIAKILGIPIVYYLVEEQISLHRQKSTKQISKKIKQFLTEVFDYKFQYLVLFRFCTFVGCITNELQDYLIENWKLKPHKLFILPNVKFVENGNEIKIQSRFSNNRTISFFYGGEINFLKEDLPLFIKELSKVRDKESQINYDVTVSGYGKDAERFDMFIKENNLKNWVHFKGFVGIEEHKQLLLSSNICLVLKSTIDFNRYNFPTKLLDYLLHGKIVLLSSQSVYKNIFVDKQNCLIVERVEKAILAEKLQWIINHPEEISKISKNAYRTIVENFNAGKITESIILKLKKS